MDQQARDEARLHERAARSRRRCSHDRGPTRTAPGTGPRSPPAAVARRASSAGAGASRRRMRLPWSVGGGRSPRKTARASSGGRGAVRDEAHDVAAHDAVADRALGDAVDRHPGSDGDPPHRLGPDVVPACRVPQEPSDQHDGPVGQRRDLLQHALQRHVGQVPDVDAVPKRGELAAGASAPDRSALGDVPEITTACRVPGWSRRAASSVPAHPGVSQTPVTSPARPTSPAAARSTAANDDRRAREQLGPVPDGDAQRAAGHRQDQIDPATSVLAPQAARSAPAAGRPRRRGSGRGTRCRSRPARATGPGASCGTCRRWRRPRGRAAAPDRAVGRCAAPGRQRA